MQLMDYLRSKRGKTISTADIKGFIRKEMSIDDGSKDVLVQKAEGSFKGITITQTANLIALNTAGGLRTLSSDRLKTAESDVLQAIVKAETNLNGASAAIARSPTRPSFGAQPISRQFKMKHLNSGTTAKSVASQRATGTGIFQGAIPQTTNTNIATSGERLLLQDMKANAEAGVYEAVYKALAGLQGSGVVQVEHVAFRTSVSLTTTTYTVNTVTGGITEAVATAPIWYAMTQDDQGNYICNHFGGVAQWNSGTSRYDDPDAVHTWKALDYNTDPALTKLASKPECRYVVDTL